MSIRRKPLPIVFFAFCCCSVLPLAAQTDQESDVRAGIRKFSQVYEALESNYADKIDPDQAVYHGAIPGMLRTLDPHSTFFDPKAYQIMREGQSGHYSGVGMMIWAPEGKVMVLNPFSGTPAFKAGLRAGDVIAGVNGVNTEKSLVTEVSGLLKGPRGTTATIKVKRLGSPEPLTFTVVRDTVPRDSVNYAFWIKPGIAYMKIDAFNETTSHEVDRTLQRFGENSMEGLVLDLRGNPGGLVNEAVNVADRFLHKGQSVVSHRGRASAETKFAAKRGERGPEYPIVVLVNSGTASAAEILAGSLQDHDRAWIFGENTFGKGLVQAPFPLSGNSALLLTIAKYYTPSGRLIQRDYAHRSFYEYYSRNEGQNNDKDMRKTDSGRVVFGGDGISPDERYSAAKLTPLESRLLGRAAFFFFAVDYFSNHGTRMAKEWRPGAEEMESFQAFARKRNVTFSPAEFEHDRAWIQERLRDELFITAFSKEDADRAALENDPEIRKAVESLPASKALLKRARDVIAARPEKRSATAAVAR